MQLWTHLPTPTPIQHVVIQEHIRLTSWYVAQVQTGREAETLRLLTKHADPTVLLDAFSPQRE